MRKRTSHAFVNEFLVYSLVALCFSGSIGLGTVWMRHQISIVANANKTLDLQIADIERHIEETGTAIATEQDAAVLEKRNIDWHLGYQPASPAQVQRVAQDPIEHLAAKLNQDLFDRGTPKVSFRVALGR